MYLHVDKIICSANALEKMNIIAFSFKMFYFSVKGAHLIFIAALFDTYSWEIPNAHVKTIERKLKVKS